MKNETPEKKLDGLRLIDFTVRTVVSFALLYFIGVAVWGLVFPESAQQSKLRPTVAETTEQFATEEPFSFVDSFRQGGWSFGESDWNISSESLTRRPTKSELLLRPAELRAYDPSFEDDKILNIFRAIARKPEKKDGLDVWWGKLSGTEAVLLSTVSENKDVVQCVRLLIEEEPDPYAEIPNQQTYTLLTLIPKPGDDADLYRLMPLPQQATQIAVRRAEEKISSAIVEFDGKIIDMLSWWKENGWETAEVLEGTNLNPKYRCTKGTDQVIATFIRQDAQYQIILVRAPN